MDAEDWKNVQLRLVKLGFNPGPVDGIRGRQTTNAVRRFQESAGLVADGIVGPRTMRALFGDSPTGVTPEFDTMPWYEEARRLVGVREVAGSGSAPEILAFAKTIDIDYPSDDIPWCGLFVGHCIGATLGDEPLPANPLGARAWLGFGQPCEPQLGAVLVFWRESKTSFKGHVGFYHGEEPDNFHVLGGNQSDAVSVVKMPRSRFLGARWPLTATAPLGRKIAGEQGVALTTGNEA